MLRWLYHRFLSVALRLVGLNFGWYLTFYRSVVHAVPIVEPLIQLVRSRPAVERTLDVMNLSLVKPGDTVLDIGANVGTVSSLFLSLGLTVHAYEPDSRCVALLKRRFSLYGRNRFFVHHCAVDGRSGTARLNYGSLTTESNSIIAGKPGADGANGGELVTKTTIEEILRSHGYVPLIKMDIEGSEYGVLEAMLENCLDKFGMCIVETHAQKIPGLQPRHDKLLSTIDAMNLGNRIVLSWR
jgi:FkbM family methyltransferase